MVDEPTADAGEAFVTPKVEGSGAISPSDAARALANWRTQQRAAAAAASPSAINAAARAAMADKSEPTPQPESAEPATAVPESVDETDATPPQEATGETEEADPAEEPPLDLPSSWTKEQSEHWKALPRATQEYVLARDKLDSDVLRKSQNETAAERKQYEADRQKFEQARQQYEAAVPALLSALQQSLAGEFSDIQTMDDVTRLATDDWARFNRWQAHQMKIAQVAKEAETVQQRQASEASSSFSKFAQEQDKLFIERAPEFADKAKAAKLQDAAVNVLRDIGFTDEELGRHWLGQDKLSLRDHRVQLLIADGIRYREAQAQAKTVKAKPLPPVQRPGVAQPSNRNGVEAQIQSLEKQLDSERSPLKQARMGAELIRLRREAAARTSR